MNRGAQSARWIVRGVMVAVILLLAVQRGTGGGELLVLGAIITGALLLPVILTWSWRRTAELIRWQRVAVTAGVAIALLLVFAAIVNTLVG